MSNKSDVEEAIIELENIVVGEGPDDEYQYGFRDACQHAIVCLRDVMGDE